MKGVQMVKYIAEEIIKMKKIAALILAAVLLSSCAAALAEGIPPLSTFAVMKTMTKDNVVTVSLSKPVDKLYANWPAELTVVELAVGEDLKANVLLNGHSYQLGVTGNMVGYRPSIFSLKWASSKKYVDKFGNEVDPFAPAQAKKAVDKFGNEVKSSIPAQTKGSKAGDKYSSSLSRIRSTIDQRGWGNAWRMRGVHALASLEDRAYITLQGNWIVCYNRQGDIVEIASAGEGNIQNVRDVAFAN